ncbi:hypothetical protein H5410_002314 [Solanum commersonii]|uniref:Phosphatase n=1 Tax=Solanum commersonii TaxID=4109 RepID=A0A9J6B1E4_SOLCO|nr:hypothetical protein H5410_002314 [Solanum commersonii]
MSELGIVSLKSTQKPGYVDEERILPYVDFQKYPHGCNLCPPNMCKGMMVERIQASMAKEGKKRMIYLGDGIGDFCPMERHFVMPRKDFPAWNLINENRTLIKAGVHEWKNWSTFFYG